MKRGPVGSNLWREILCTLNETTREVTTGTTSAVLLCTGLHVLFMCHPRSVCAEFYTMDV